jgi:toxin-antitoxin system PIN domain toxin
MYFDPGVVDANILVYAFNADVPQHAASRALIEASRLPSGTLYVTSQILCEFYSIITNVRRFPQAVSPFDAVRILSALLALPGLVVLPAPASVVANWMQLLQRQPVTGGDIFDLQIVATMLANGIARIYTFNADDFKVFPGLTVVTP